MDFHNVSLYGLERVESEFLKEKKQKTVAQGESQKQTRSIYPGLSTRELNPNLLLVQSAKYI